jgi:subtilase family serine protease
MKPGKIFALLLSFTLLVGAAGMLPSTVTAKMAPFIVKGPKAVLAQPAAGGGSPIFTCQLWGSQVVCYDPFQMRRAYSINPLLYMGYTGAGRTIVIVDAFQSPTLSTDLDVFDAAYHLPSRAAFFTQVAPDGLTSFDPSNDDMNSWAGEITLDVEWAHAIAPGAHIVLVLSKSDSDADILSAEQYAVAHNLGDVISQSFGENESCVDSSVLTAEHQLYVTATQKGMTIFASSGDEGAAELTCDGKSWVKAASSPASDPLVTGVGGTTLDAAGYCFQNKNCNPANHPSPGTYKNEMALNELGVISPAGVFSSGGGYSLLYQEPSYQVGSVPGKARGVPDVSYSAAVFHGVLGYLSTYDSTSGKYVGGWYLFGGTSAGSPQWAAIAAIADQKAGKRLGFINGALYRLQRSATYPKVFHDVKNGNNSVYELDDGGHLVFVTGFFAHNAWDAVTGLGSPNTTQLVNSLVLMGSNFALPALSTLNPVESGSPAFGPGLMQPH